MKIQRPVNKNASREAFKLLEYLSKIEGNGIISGQHTQTNPMEEIEYIKNVTGKEPLLRGFELLSYSPNINYDDMSEECLKEIEENRGTVRTAIEWVLKDENALDKKGDFKKIVTLSFHWYSPIGGRDKSFYSENTDFDPIKILNEGSAERKAFYEDMEKIADILKEFKDNNIPVLWRPFHESDGEWFWWGRKGPEIAKELYKLMFDYYVTEKDLNNLIWVWNCRLSSGYPGDEFVDIISLDEYLSEYKPTDYKEQYDLLVKETTNNKLAALAEIGYLPDIEMLSKSKIPWVYFMVWSKEFIMGEKYNSVQNLKKAYDNEYLIKKD